MRIPNSAVSAHGSDNGAVGYLPCGVHDGLTCCHHDIQEELVCISQEFDDVIAVLFVHIHLGNHRADLFQESQGYLQYSSGGTRLPWRLPWLQEKFTFSPPMERMALQRLVPAHPASSTAGGQPPPWNMHRTPQHLADSLIHGTVCLIAVSLVLNHEHRHVSR